MRGKLQFGEGISKAGITTSHLDANIAPCQADAGCIPVPAPDAGRWKYQPEAPARAAPAGKSRKFNPDRGPRLRFGLVLAQIRECTRRRPRLTLQACPFGPKTRRRAPNPAPSLRIVVVLPRADVIAARAAVTAEGRHRPRHGRPRLAVGVALEALDRAGPLQGRRAEQGGERIRHRVGLADRRPRPSPGPSSAVISLPRYFSAGPSASRPT